MTGNVVATLANTYAKKIATGDTLIDTAKVRAEMAKTLEKPIISMLKNSSKALFDSICESLRERITPLPKSALDEKVEEFKNKCLDQVGEMSREVMNLDPSPELLQAVEDVVKAGTEQAYIENQLLQVEVCYRLAAAWFPHLRGCVCIYHLVSAMAGGSARKVD